jgi:hypothetical protein
LRKATISFFMSVRQSVCLHGTTRLRLEAFSWNLMVFFQKLGKIRVSLKSDTNIGYFTWRHIYIYDNCFSGATAPRGPPHYRKFTIILRHTTLGRTPLDEWSARRRDLYLPRPRRDSNPQSQQTNGRRPTPETARPLGSAHVYHTEFFKEWEMFQRKVVGKINICILCSVTFF